MSAEATTGESSVGRGGRLYGLIAEFETPGMLIAATTRARAAGYRRMDAYAPYPIEDLTHALGHHRSRLPLLVLIGGVVGFVIHKTRRADAAPSSPPVSEDLGDRPV